MPINVTHNRFFRSREASFSMEPITLENLANLFSKCYYSRNERLIHESCEGAVKLMSPYKDTENKAQILGKLRFP